ncbi:triacylglycerol lipase [Teladorsagia circumcincta]|uniref:Triacylglycerol lipase n=1 Tax=Teladorsagia circumcincta TaxID=45464 RepID=A0A2G9USF6_TELCI|nr:triacylglycerol lipase [Teladorsagia circumcincta]
MILLLAIAFLGYANADVQYSDSLARNVMFPLSAAAYSDQPQQCLSRLFPKSKLQRQVTVKCDKGGSEQNKTGLCSGFTAVLHKHKAIALSFRGTVASVQLFQEINKTVFLKLASWFYGGKISKYFSDAFSNIWFAGMGDDYLFLRERFPKYEVWITGHSLGGALASLAASFLVGSRMAMPNKVKLVTFGQPRTGDSNFSDAFNSQAFYKEDMSNYTICNEGEDVECSDGLWFPASFDAHTHYFGHHVSQYGKSGCAN